MGGIFMNSTLIRTMARTWLLVAVFFAPRLAIGQVEPPPQPLVLDGAAIVRGMNDAFVAVYEKVSPAVVIIETKRNASSGRRADFFHDYLFRGIPDEPASEREMMSQGSGMLIRADGHIMTNYHVIAGGDSIEVTLRDGTKRSAKLVGMDERTDIAVIKIDGEARPFLEFADPQAVRVGQLACAIGAPFELDYSLTVGWVSGLNRNRLQMRRWGSNLLYEDYLQTDAAINPGNSGGPLVDVEGSVIGMNTMIQGINSGVGFAIPADILRHVSGQLIAEGKVARPWLGISIETSQAREEQPKKPRGVLVKTVVNDAPAFHADMREGDVIVAVDDRAVRSDRELQREVFFKKVGSPVKLDVWRAEREMEIVVTAGEMQASPVFTRSNESREDRPLLDASGLFGLEIQPATDAVRLQFALTCEDGVPIITVVQPHSAAARAAMKAGDEIVEVAGESQPGPERLEELFHEATNEGMATLRIRREGKIQTFNLKLEAVDE